MEGGGGGVPRVRCGWLPTPRTPSRWPHEPKRSRSWPGAGAEHACFAGGARHRDRGRAPGHDPSSCGAAAGSPTIAIAQGPRGVSEPQEIVHGRGPGPLQGHAPVALAGAAGFGATRAVHTAIRSAAGYCGQRHDADTLSPPRLEAASAPGRGISGRIGGLAEPSPRGSARRLTSRPRRAPKRSGASGAVRPTPP